MAQPQCHESQVESPYYKNTPSEGNESQQSHCSTRISLFRYKMLQAQWNLLPVASRFRSLEFQSMHEISWPLWAFSTLRVGALPVRVSQKSRAESSPTLASSSPLPGIKAMSPTIWVWPWGGKKVLFYASFWTLCNIFHTGGSDAACMS